MWLFTIDGFYSAVQHDYSPHQLLVRARDRGDLVRARERMGMGPANPILHTPHGDYAYRMTVSKTEWAYYLTLATEAIEYRNFKAAVHAAQGDERADIYFDVWSAMLALQDHE